MSKWTLARRVISAFALVALASYSTGSLAQSVASPDAFKALPDRLRKLSSFVDAHLKSVQTINRIASRRFAQAGKKKTNTIALPGVEGTQAIENMLRSLNLETRLGPLELDILQDHQRQLEEFSR